MTDLNAYLTAAARAVLAATEARAARTGTVTAYKAWLAGLDAAGLDHECKRARTWREYLERFREPMGGEPKGLAEAERVERWCVDEKERRALGKRVGGERVPGRGQE